ncbi:MAG: hypothetical protein Q7U63_05560 [Polaromonas sp.]|uniref:hypothetical protein n=1 Tax=Polaromonas sp. TaxID=1869339 RepID=UPI002724B905|nr:hypothetical protein [Polaromonas sp.]MDO9113247.1 hypothetical protein [Polaromonas sp.]MDP1886934.1 hypothetical protein [Polaromonas sp.]
MDQRITDNFRQHYLQLPEEDLEALDARKASLTEEAQVALVSVLSERDVLVGKIRRLNAAEDQRRTQAVQEVSSQKELRNAKLVKWFFFVSVPVIALSALLGPEQAWQTLISSTVQAVGIFVAIWVALFIKRKLSVKNSKSNADNV